MTGCFSQSTVGTSSHRARVQVSMNQVGFLSNTFVCREQRYMIVCVCVCTCFYYQLISALQFLVRVCVCVYVYVHLQMYLYIYIFTFTYLWYYDMIWDLFMLTYAWRMFRKILVGLLICMEIEGNWSQQMSFELWAVQPILWVQALVYQWGIVPCNQVYLQESLKFPFAVGIGWYRRCFTTRTAI